MRICRAKQCLVLTAVTLLSSGCTSRPMSQPSTTPSGTASHNKFDEYLNTELPPADYPGSDAR